MYLRGEDRTHDPNNTPVAVTRLPQESSRELICGTHWQIPAHLPLKSWIFECVLLGEDKLKSSQFDNFVL